tara:strand:+ start:9272 stop:10987 length:1716 start_codon:yes stop_codon:yes gene_type:complete
MFNLGIHGAHNASVAISKDDKVLEVVEIERLMGIKNCGFFYYEAFHNPTSVLCFIRDYFKEKYGVEKYETIAVNCMPGDEEYHLLDYGDVFDYENYEHVFHHEAHASSAFYQSPYENALIISFDGGSEEKFFNIYLAQDRQSPLKKLYCGKHDYAVSYMACAHYIPHIRREQIYIGNLVYPGKLMGYAAYGEPQEEYIKKFRKFYLSRHTDEVQDAAFDFGTIFGVGFRNINPGDPASDPYHEIDGPGFLDEKVARDVAASNQYVFEELFYEEVKPFFDTYFDYPVVLTGGCALNIINNTKIAELREGEVFVPPNPNDTGIGLGCLLKTIKPYEQVDATYLGPEVWDKYKLAQYFGKYPNADRYDPIEIAEKLFNGLIFGVVRGGSELGPRALGNRSLICSAAHPVAKQVMNQNVKNREMYRPLSPIVRLEDAQKYFEWEYESRHMTYSVPVREEYREILHAITHVDGTARIQTVTEEQNEFIYELLCAMDEANNFAVLLNTSFNVAGKPILNTYEEAFDILETKPINGLIIEDYYFPSKTWEDKSPLYNYWPVNPQGKYKVKNQTDNFEF